MNLEKYFSEITGLGVIATANNKGEVNTAVYAKPHLLNDHTIALIMRDRLTRKNLQSNPLANYMFIEDQQGFHGVRLSLRMQDESTDSELIALLSRRESSASPVSEEETRYLVTFKVEKALTLVGGNELQLH